MARTSQRDPKRDRLTGMDLGSWSVEFWGGRGSGIRSRTNLRVITSLVPRVQLYSFYDSPRAWPATTRHREAEGSSYYRHFYMGLLREDGTPKRAMRLFAALAPALGISPWFHFEDHGLDEAVAWLKRLGVRHLRTGLSWADSLRPNADAWFDRQMAALEEFDVKLTFCFTPESCGLRPHHTSPPRQVEEFADFCARMVRRYCPPAAAARSPLGSKTSCGRRVIHAQ